MILNQISRFNFTLTHMITAFNKYQGTGNDFIIIDNRYGVFNPENHELVKFLCNRRFGIGADGLHESVEEMNIIRLKMSNVSGFEIIDGHYFINTGSPHYVVFTSDIDQMDVNEEGKRLRWSKKFEPGGTNVNFVEVNKNGLYLRTFERGVEEETLACGTGVTASAIASVLKGHFDTAPVRVKARGGDLEVDFKVKDGKVTNVWLTGPATFVFEGVIEI